MEKLEDKIPRDIKRMSKKYPIINYKKEYGEEDTTENIAKGEIERFNFTIGGKNLMELGQKANKITWDEKGNEYSTIWVHLGKDYFKQISKVYDPRTC